jgi:manganese/zinc/iron transport system ATP- binding protein
VPQRESVDWDFPVNAVDVVAMGRYRRIGWFKPVSLHTVRQPFGSWKRSAWGPTPTARSANSPGGQQQRVFLARALAQDAALYFMDEPFAGVDVATEKAIVALLKELKAAGKTCVVVHHDLQTVPSYFDHVVLLNMRVVAAGPTETVFTEENLKKTYGGKLTLLSQALHAYSQQAAAQNAEQKDAQ